MKKENEEGVLMITMMTTKDDNKGDEKKLKGQEYFMMISRIKE